MSLSPDRSTPVFSKSDSIATILPLTSPAADDWTALNHPMIVPAGFRDYDARWRFPEEINLPGLTALGLGIGTQMHQAGVPPRIVVGMDFRSYSLSVKNALMIGLQQAGIAVLDIGTCITPVAYFARDHLDCRAVAMVTASHNPNGWTGVKLGFVPPLTHGPEEMAALRQIVLDGAGQPRPGGSITTVPGVAEAYIDDICGDFRLGRPLRVVCATGNGTASAFAPEILRRIGADVVPLHTTPDHSFPHYNPNPEALEMLHDMVRAVRESGADLALGFDGDGDRCGVVDDTGAEIFADKVGLLLARDLARAHPSAHFVADIKSTGLFAIDPVLRDLGVRVEYARTGHSHMKRRLHETGALAGFEKSGHFFFAPPLGRGYDCAMRAAVEVCRLMDRHPGRALSDLHRDLPASWSSPTMSPHCPDTEKRAVVERLTARLCRNCDEGTPFAGARITRVLTTDGARVHLDNGGWGLVRASSNTPNLVVVCESMSSRNEMVAIFAALDSLIRNEPSVGAYDQSIPS